MRTDATTKLEDIEHSAEEVARTTQDSARIMIDYALRTQELNMKLAQQAVEAWLLKSGNLSASYATYGNRPPRDVMPSGEPAPL